MAKFLIRDVLLVTHLVRLKLRATAFLCVLVSLFATSIFGNTSDSQGPTSIYETLYPESFKPYRPSTQDMARWQENAKLLEKFASTPEFVDYTLTTADNQVRGELEHACVVEGFAECQAYIRENREDVLTALPSNPDYWAAFWALFQKDGFLSNSDLALKARFNKYNVMQWWFYRDLADDGRVNIDRAIALQNGLRDWTRGYRTVFDAIQTSALKGIAANQFSMAMAQASAVHDNKSIDTLEKLLKPVDTEALSWGYAFALEWYYIAQSLEETQAKNLSEEDTQTAILEELEEYLGEKLWSLDQETFEEAQRDPTQFAAQLHEFVGQAYIAPTEAAWHEYWRFGLPSTLEIGASTPSFVADLWPDYSQYMAIERMVNFQNFIFAALADIYTGRVSPGLPSRPAPARWQWVWESPSDESKQTRLCLASNQLHPSTHLYEFVGQEKDYQQICVDYYDEATAMALVID